ncbi:MAG: methyltransferase domain-containing protein [Trueperaceae bacterium]
MSFLLPKRAVHLRERMDDPQCDLQKLNNTYQYFHVVNQFLSGWLGIYKDYLRPRLYDGATLLDVGCGGGDILRQLALWTQQDGLKVTLRGVDPDTRALEYARKRSNPLNVHFESTTSAALLAAGRQFDIVISNHVLHHLDDAEVVALCQDSERLAKCFSLHNDIRRSSLAYASFTASKLLFWNSFVTEDGLCSIRRSFTKQELQNVVPATWQVKPMFPYRNLLLWEKKKT